MKKEYNCPPKCPSCHRLHYTDEGCERKALGPSDAPTCSPSSTPETEAMLNFLSKEWPDRGDFEIALAGFARKLERERDEWREKAEHRSIFVTTTGDALDSVLMAIRAYRDAKGRYHTQKACERLLTFLPENADVEAPNA